MSPVQALLTDTVREAASRGLLCWLAKVDAEGQPNVSPQEIWSIADDAHVVVANIATYKVQASEQDKP